MDEDERDDVEAQALDAMIELYGDQMARILAALGSVNLQTLTAAQLAALFADEPELTAAAYIEFWLPIAEALALAGVIDLVGAGNPALNPAGSALSDGVETLLERYMRLTGELFGEQISDNSRQLTFEVIQNWRVDEGATVADLRQSLRKVWEGPRPEFAATTETTRIVAESRGIAWREAEFWGFDIVTRGIRTRETHQAVADAGPYPMSLWDEQHVPPLFGDVNCFCDVLPVVEDPNG